jgi:hypothetical protein
VETIQTELSQAQQYAAAERARADTLEPHLTPGHQAPAVKRKPRPRKPLVSKSAP